MDTMKKISVLLWCFSLFCIALIFHNCLPFVQTPAFNSLKWATGFSQSIANNSLLYPYAVNFGIPTPAPAAIGLSVMWPVAAVIRLGVQPYDAYTIVIAIYLGCAFCGATLLSRRFGVSLALSALGALCWMSFTVNWRSLQGFSCLGLGMTMLPTYFYLALRFFEAQGSTITRNGIIYLMSTIVSIFMDGYTFTMNAFMTTCLVLYISFFKKRNIYLLIIICHFISFFLSYVLYKLYVVNLPLPNYSTYDFYFFGLELPWLFIPKYSFSLFFTKLGFYSKNAIANGHGVTNVFPPVLFLFILSFFMILRKGKIKGLPLLILFIGMFSMWLALGPNIKLLNSEKLMNIEWNPSIPREGIPTGNEFLYKYIPGFKVMRASWRWIALYSMALWAIIMIGVSYWRKKFIPFVLLLLIIICHIPNNFFTHGVYERVVNVKFENQVISLYKKYISPHERVVFIPRDNDFIVNYVSSRIGFTTYNIGGDKNISLASESWPGTLALLNIGEFNIHAISCTLYTGLADVVVVPFQRNNLPSDEFPVPISRGWWSNHKIWKHELEKLGPSLGLDVTFTPYFAVVRAGHADKQVFLEKLKQSIKFPIRVGDASTFLTFESGWYSAEHSTETNGFIWSNQNASLKLKISDDIHGWIITYGPYASSNGRPVDVIFSSKIGDDEWTKMEHTTDSNVHSIFIPKLPNLKTPFQTVNISVPNATSPNKLGDSEDHRILGIAVHEISTTPINTSVTPKDDSAFLPFKYLVGSANAKY